ncbi:alanine--tRNA ligase [Parvularcula dongshanensis]|uniref:Alanine--tRNA ligase n=1 Tax=Parvularcula dongshanensis TaxID=1173995 RepID=A0A840I5F4_9PROT|nr:alanine--tRNA ligase [Parvularcula dongshanensis]MBB4659555.1 alanyl-tRNA synthetase [Parvularcula dongshanensis]
MTHTVNDIRAAFLSFFEGRGHEVVPSAPLVPQNDPTLLFVNAGMVPFKNVFTGAEKRPYSRATSSQKCVRAGGKHNDLDNVGYTARHHTFFEMLGNFSFGDYFKEEAIEAAWKLVTAEFGLAPEKLLVTVYHTDDEAADLWKRIAGLPDERIIRIATSDNFWSMGDTGPCGPCSEIFYDHGPHIAGGPPGSPDEDGDRFVEIWNLVFMQFDQQEGGERVALPKPSIDTGAGLERMATVLQGVHSNYETDLFRTLIDASVELTGRGAEGDDAAAHRVIADHLRACSFLIADGVSPSNEGRGYVLRRIARRAMRYANVLGAEEPLMHRLVPTLTAEMGGAFPELVRAQVLIEDTLRVEEERFSDLLTRGLKLLSDETAKLPGGGTLPGEAAFRLYDTYGFPLDLTADALKRQGYGLDAEGFDAAMAEQKTRARAAWAGSGDAGADRAWLEVASEKGTTEFIGYAHERAEGTVVAIVKDASLAETAEAGDTIAFAANQTPFYGESGGQTGDSGTAETEGGARLRVTDTKKKAGVHVHEAVVEEGSLRVGDTLTLRVDHERRAAIKANHSGTHLLHAALRRHLGTHVVQKGSYVGPDAFRFDFSHDGAVGAEALDAVEAEVNRVVRQNAEGLVRYMAYDDAIKEGAMALFGEKYGDEVRVMTLGRDPDDETKPYSVELCGGTHVDRTGDVALFAVTSEGAVASGVRRIEAVTGEGARAYLKGQANAAIEAAAALKTKPEELAERVRALTEERKKLEKQLTEARKKAATGGGGAPKAEAVGDALFTSAVLEGVPPKELRGMIAQALKEAPNAVAAFIAVNDGKASVSIGVGDALTASHPAPSLVQAAVTALGGKGGGGKPDLAHGGGPDAGAAQAAIGAVRAMLG